MYVFAGLLSSLKVRACAEWLTFHAYDITTIARLRGYFPTQFVFLNLAQCCYLKSFFLSCVHCVHLFPLYTISIYYQGLTCQYPWYILYVYTVTEEGSCTKRRRWKSGQPTRNRIGAAVGMNGSRIGQERDPAYAQSAKVPIGIGRSSLGARRHRMLS